MGNNIFISSADTFDVTINYKSEGRRVKILTEAEKDDKGVITSQSVTVTFRLPTFSDSQQIMRSATTIDASGQPQLNFLQLQTGLLYGLIKAWNVIGEDGKPVEVNPANVSKLRVEIAKELVNKVYSELGEGGLI